MENKIHRIVLTGGPCSGKTTAMVHINERLSSLGFNVYIVPEAASLLILGGIKLLEGDVFSKQLSLLKLQKQLEDSFILDAQRSDKPAIILCDRGILDIKAFNTTETWNELLIASGGSNVEFRDSRYEAVIHLVTTAIGAPEFYTLDNNAARSESLQQAAILDQKIQDSWVGHPHLRVVGNSTNFQDKIRKVIALVANVVGVPEPIERERKFLVSGLNYDNTSSIHKECLDIEQTYLKNETGSARVRKRGQHGHYTFTHTIKKKISNGKNIELERMISEKEFNLLLETRDPARNTIYKQRTCFVWNGQYFELDYFVSPKKGLWLLEAEIESDDDQVVTPPFINIEKEVTDDDSYSNSEISKY